MRLFLLVFSLGANKVHVFTSRLYVFALTSGTPLCLGSADGHLFVVVVQALGSAIRCRSILLYAGMDVDEYKNSTLFLRA